MNTTDKQQSISKRDVIEILIYIVLILLAKNFILSGGRVPSGSMEPTIYQGDFLLKNVHSCGGTTPQTLLAIPFLPPRLGIRTYLPWLQIPSFRFRPTEDIHVGDICTFRTVIGRCDETKKGKAPPPLDCRPEWIKRTAGIQGQSIKMDNGVLYVRDGSGEYVEDKYQPRRQYVFNVWLNGKVSAKFLDNYTSLPYKAYSKQPKSDLKLGYYCYHFVIQHKHLNKYFAALQQRGLQQMSRSKAGKFTVLDEEKKPLEALTDVEADAQTDFEEVTIPYKGMTIDLNDKTHPLYIKTIENSLRHFKVKEKDGTKQFIKDGATITSYTFEQDHVFMLGDNTGNSEDSRFFGFLPKDHLVSKVRWVVFNWKNFRRFFKRVY